MMTRRAASILETIDIFAPDSGFISTNERYFAGQPRESAFEDQVKELDLGIGKRFLEFGTVPIQVHQLFAVLWLFLRVSE